MTRYSGSGRYGSRRNYKTNIADLYRMLRRSPYRNPYRINSLERYRQSQSRGGYRPSTRSYSRPHFPRQRAEPKYKPMPKERISSPMRRERLRYAERHNIRTEPDAERMIKDVEGRLNQQLIQKLEAEINKLRSEIDNERVGTSDVEGSIEPQETLGQEGDHSKQTETIEAKETKENSETTSEVETETPEKVDHLEAYVIDEGWIDEDGLNTLIPYLESKLERADIERGNSENRVETELEENEATEKADENIENEDVNSEWIVSEDEEVLRDMYLEDEAEVLREIEVEEELEEAKPDGNQIEGETSTELSETTEPAQEAEASEIPESKGVIEPLLDQIEPIESELEPIDANPLPEILPENIEEEPLEEEEY